jgi:hypothetical protein
MRIKLGFLVVLSLGIGCVVHTTSGEPQGSTTGGTTVVTGGGTTTGGGVAGEKIEEIVLDDGRTLTLRHSAPMDPSIAGCADGTREAFHDPGAFPSIAGCGASWVGEQSLRTPATNVPCGDEPYSMCNRPTDACAPGWHLCGTSGAVDELRGRVSADQCETAGGGRYSAAISHCASQEGCEVGDQYACYESGWCSEPVCCGNDCGEFGACADGVWPGRTHIPVGTDQGCGRTSSVRAGGVLCCR